MTHLQLAPDPRSMSPKRIGLVIGTRPEAIKVAPLIGPLVASESLEPVVILSGQHHQVVIDVLEQFDVEYTAPLLPEVPGRSLVALGAELLVAFETTFEELDLHMVVVHGDTATAFAGGLAAYLARIPVAHLEAGLRSGSMTEPFPEEFNRVSIDSYAELCLAPTELAARNLRDEGVPGEKVFITGNTVVDALHSTLARPKPPAAPEVRRALNHDGEVVLATAHRRESWGTPIKMIMRAIVDIANGHPDTLFAFATHPNPVLRGQALEMLGGVDNVEILPPLPYSDLVQILDRSVLVLTDSGGIQEEACALNTRTLILRERTERPEAIDAGMATLVGSDRQKIVDAASCHLAGQSHTSISDVFGDGFAAQRCVSAMLHHFGFRNRPEHFRPAIKSLDLVS